MDIESNLIGVAMRIANFENSLLNYALRSYYIMHRVVHVGRICMDAQNILMATDCDVTFVTLPIANAYFEIIVVSFTSEVNGLHVKVTTYLRKPPKYR